MSENIIRIETEIDKLYQTIVGFSQRDKKGLARLKNYIEGYIEGCDSVRERLKTNNIGCNSKRMTTVEKKGVKTSSKIINMKNRRKSENDGCHNAE